MGPFDVAIIVLVCLIVGASVFYVIRSKKKGVKCIGCPEGCRCSSGKGGCAGCGKQSAFHDQTINEHHK